MSIENRARSRSTLSRLEAAAVLAFCGSLSRDYYANAAMRITLGGGGTDLPSYHERFGWPGLVSGHQPPHLHSDQPDMFTDDYFLKYSSLERVGKNR